MVQTHRILLLVCACWILALSVLGQHDAADTEGARQTPALKPEEMFQDIFPLTSENFTECLLRSKDPWIVIFHDGNLERQWKTMATQVRGLVWFGMIDVTRETELVDMLEHKPSSGTARIYPHGHRLYKERNWKYVRNEDEAKMAALRSLPDDINEVDGEDIKDVLTDAFMSIPSRFPTFLILDEEQTPAVFKSLALRFEKYFLFSKIVKPSKSDLNSLGLGDMAISPPELFILLTTSGDPDSARAVRFDDEKYGGMNYTKIMEFLFSVNSRFRHELPGVNLANSQQEAEMSDVIEIEKKRFLILHGNEGATKFDHKTEPPKPEGITETGNFRFKVTKETGIRDEL